MIRSFLCDDISSVIAKMTREMGILWNGGHYLYHKICGLIWIQRIFYDPKHLVSSKIGNFNCNKTILFCLKNVILRRSDAFSPSNAAVP